MNLHRFHHMGVASLGHHHWQDSAVTHQRKGLADMHDDHVNARRLQDPESLAINHTHGINTHGVT